jgi:hypothetical protein
MKPQPVLNNFALLSPRHFELRVQGEALLPLPQFFCNGAKHHYKKIANRSNLITLTFQ